MSVTYFAWVFVFFLLVSPLVVKLNITDMNSIVDTFKNEPRKFAMALAVALVLAIPVTYVTRKAIR
jgi:uncharacterized Tic20 family protein